MYAILLDGGYLTKALRARYKRPVTADDIVAECHRLQGLPEVAEYELLRIYYYDALPSSASISRPVSGDAFHLGETERFRHAQSLFDQLVLKPNMALRMGRVDLTPRAWRLKASVVKELVAQQRALTDEDFELDMGQKGVDMRIGMDMARLALRNMVRAVVVVTGDSDFVPAFKFVRREGVRVILEPYGRNGRQELRSHADIVLSQPKRARIDPSVAVAAEQKAAPSACQ